MFVVNAFYLYKRSQVLSSEKIDIKTFLHEIAAALVGPQLSNPEYEAHTDFHYLAKLPPTEKKESKYFCENLKTILHYA